MFEKINIERYKNVNDFINEHEHCLRARNKLINLLDGNKNKAQPLCLLLMQSFNLMRSIVNPILSQINKSQESQENQENQENYALICIWFQRNYEFMVSEYDKELKIIKKLADIELYQIIGEDKIKELLQYKVKIREFKQLMSSTMNAIVPVQPLDFQMFRNCAQIMKEERAREVAEQQKKAKGHDKSKSTPKKTNDEEKEYEEEDSESNISPSVNKSDKDLSKKSSKWCCCSII